MKDQCFEPADHWRLRSYKAIIAFLFMNAFSNVIANQICSLENPQLPKYHLIEKCYRSKLGIAAKANLSSIISCQRLATEKKGK